MQVAEPKCQCLQLFYSKGHSAVLSLHSPALKRLELHIWLPNDHPPPPTAHTRREGQSPRDTAAGEGGQGGGLQRDWLAFFPQEGCSEALPRVAGC